MSETVTTGKSVRGGVMRMIIAAALIAGLGVAGEHAYHELFDTPIPQTVTEASYRKELDKELLINLASCPDGDWDCFETAMAQRDKTRDQFVFGDRAFQMQMMYANTLINSARKDIEVRARNLQGSDPRLAQLLQDLSNDLWHAQVDISDISAYKPD